MDTTLAVAIFVTTYALIVSERVHKTTAALVGGAVVIAAGVLTTEEAFEFIDLNVIILLASMMIIANTMASTGVFQWLAIRAAKAAGGSPIKVTILLCAITAGISAFLDNVTTVVLIAPVTLVIAQTLEVRAVPMLIAQALASNIGGTATLIGDPPNIIIGAHAGIGFGEFASHLAPVAILCLVFFLFVAYFFGRSELRTTDRLRARVMEMDDSEVITDPGLLRTSSIVLGLTILGFLFHGALGYEAAAVALMGASLLLLVTRADPHAALRDVEWSTLFFFIGLFIVVGGLEHVGILEEVGQRAIELTGGSETTAAFLVLWMSGLLSGVIDNIPYTVTMLPIIDQLALGIDTIDETSSHVLWWALAIGADMGGNLTIIGASANVLVANLAERAEQPISFWEFFRWGSITVVGTLLIASGYIWLRYFAFA